MAKVTVFPVFVQSNNMLGRMSFAVVNPLSSHHEQASGDMSCLSKANLQITVGVGMPAFSEHPFKKFCTIT